MPDVKLYPTGQIIPDGKVHLMPFSEPRLSTRTACGYTDAELRRQLLEGEDSITCGACRATHYFKEES